MEATSLCRQLHSSINGSFTPIKRSATATRQIAKATLTTRSCAGNTIRVLTKRLRKVNRVPTDCAIKRAGRRMNAAIHRPPSVAAAVIVAAVVLLFEARTSQAQAPPPPDAPEVVDYA